MMHGQLVAGERADCTTEEDREHGAGGEAEERKDRLVEEVPVGIVLE
jgi:hypothetical protein